MLWLLGFCVSENLDASQVPRYKSILKKSNEFLKFPLNNQIQQDILLNYDNEKIPKYYSVFQNVKN